MAHLNERLAEARSALDELRSARNGDAAASLFPHTFETCCETARAYLHEQEHTEASSADEVIRESVRTGLLDYEEADEVRKAARDGQIARSPIQRQGEWDLLERMHHHGQVLDRWVSRMLQRGEH